MLSQESMYLKLPKCLQLFAVPQWQKEVPCVSLRTVSNSVLIELQLHCIPLGYVSTYAGSVSGTIDGFATSAKFETPFGIALDSLGTLYVSDYGSDLIRMISSSGCFVVHSLPATVLRGRLMFRHGHNSGRKTTPWGQY